MNILVTGGAGFIGSHLCEALLLAGHQVTCLDNFSTGRRENIEKLVSLNVVEGDTNEAATWQGLKGESFDVIYHYAATVGVKRTEENPQAVLRDGLGLQYLAEFAKENKIKKVVFASSSEVYGEADIVPSPESAGNKAWSPYTTVKIFGEHLMQALWNESTIPTVSLRFFNVYGPRQKGSDYGFVVSKFIEQAQSKQALTVFGDGSQTRDFVYIEDNIQAALAVLHNSKVNGQVINIGTGHETHVVDLAHAIIKSVSKDSLLEPVFLPARKIEIARRCADSKKMKDLLGVECSTELAVGLERTIATLELSPATTSAVPATV